MLAIALGSIAASPYCPFRSQLKVWATPANLKQSTALLPPAIPPRPTIRSSPVNITFRGNGSCRGERVGRCSRQRAIQFVDHQKCINWRQIPVPVNVVIRRRYLLRWPNLHGPRVHPVDDQDCIQGRNSSVRVHIERVRGIGPTHVVIQNGYRGLGHTDSRRYINAANREDQRFVLFESTVTDYSSLVDYWFSRHPQEIPGQAPETKSSSSTVPATATRDRGSTVAHIA